MTPAEMSAGLRRRAFDMQPFDASVYFSTGGGIIGLIGKPEVAQLARSTVDALRPLVAQLERSDVTDPPGAGDYCFYVLTPAGRRICRLNASGTAGRDSPEVKLIGLGGALLAKIRENAS